MSHQEQKSRLVGRRGLLKGTAVTAAAGAASLMATSAAAATPTITGSCLCPYPGVPEKWDGEYDVVVAGAGAAGLLAAIEAASAGASVVMLESEPERAGSSPLSGGVFTLCETDMVDGTADELYEDLLTSHQGDHDEALNRAYVEAAPAVYRRLVDSGVKFTIASSWAYMSKPWGHVATSAAEACDALEATATGMGVEFLTSTRALRLIAGPEGRIIGLEADQDGTPVFFRANRAVVLATGDFSRNKEMAKNYGTPGSEKIVPLTGPASIGDGLRMGLSEGADTSYLCVGVAPSAPAEYDSHAAVLIFMQGGIILDMEGKRFHNEQYSYVDITKHALRLPDPEARFLQVYDSAIREQTFFAWEGTTEYQGETLEDLAAVLEETLGVPAAAIVESVTKYNGYVEDGHDPEMGREYLTGVTGDLVKIEAAPFYAVLTVPGTTHFNGGLKITPEMRVLNVYGEVIPGLYAAGGVTGGFHGAGYMSGSALGMAAVFGHIAGINAAAEEPWG